MDISFVILTWNSERYIARCLDSLFASLEGAGLSCEVFIVDNGSRDASPDMLKAYAEKRPGVITPIFLETNVGTTVSRNMALRRASGNFLCIMDSDVEVGDGVFQGLLEVLRDNPQVGMVVPKIFYPSGKWQKSTDRFPTLAHKINRLFRLRQIEAEEGIECRNISVNCEVDYAISALWLLRREVLESVGHLDEKIFYAPEDVDYCLRVWKAGYPVLYVPSITVVHHTQEISRGWKINKAKIEHLKGLVYLFAKHGYFFRSPDFKSC
ncbi:MAG: glycosyltransferase family 2 protein [Desulfuromonadales bacterium]|nr:glycosyltransferase family 2 protein [Desulfuromonadales bacterium]